ncbi:MULTISPECIES: hypothetical protein [unclassified Rhizobium]|uniref:hypothetical protein n=1 Tax=unclassified Rhizobium TaxID=2613769 RepID=UPI001AEC89EB|nr:MULTISPECIES: hypothetical protein [unclassified Rhizobium]
MRKLAGRNWGGWSKNEPANSPTARLYAPAESIVAILIRSIFVKLAPSGGTAAIFNGLFG